ncbi:MAG: AAA family ATPase [Gammaproteobacteria bacterium]|nr:AAA family ATPase [Gammaproteobacteria bacterium]
MTTSEQAAAAGDRIAALEDAIGRAVIGQRRVLHETLVGLFAGGHVLIEGLPGLGKTLLVRSLARAVGGRFGRVQFTPDLMPSDICGHVMFDQKAEQFRVRRGPVFCNFLLADEINRAPAKTQSALLEVMQEGQVTIEGQSYAVDKPYLVLATQNPIEQEGTYPLPQAQQDRFLLNVMIDYPNAEEEVAMVRGVTANAVGDALDISAVAQVLEPAQIVELQQRAAHLEVDAAIVDYAVRIVRQTRTWQGIELGAGPRGSVALLRAARAEALMHGRHFVTPQDVKEIAAAVLRHRVKLSAEFEIEGRRTDEVLADVLVNVAAPRA